LEQIKFKFSKPSHEYPLTEGEVKNFRIKDREQVCEWAEKYITLLKPSYLFEGKFRAWEWQREPINAYNYWNRIIYIGAVQTFKSGITQIQAYYSIANLGLNGMVAYANEKKVVSAFEDTYVKMIKSNQNAVLKEQWNGKDDSLTQNKLKLNSCTWMVASAQNPDDLASFSAPITIGSEVAKWKQKAGKYDAVTLLRGRSDAAFSMGDVKRCILESSPYEEGDPLYQEAFREGTLILKPYYKCPHCGGWQNFDDHQIVLKDETFKGRPSKIREYMEEAVYYECLHCQEEITEAQRANMSEKVVWAAPEIIMDEFSQQAEEINPDGSIKGRLPNGTRKGYDQVAYWWNRFVDVAYPFWENMARFFESLHDEEKRKSYENETQARWRKIKTGRIEKTYLDSKKIEYYQWGTRHRIPDNVRVITLGIDTQDDGFYYSFVGWGEWRTWTVLRIGFIPCPRVDKGYEAQVYDKFMMHLHIEPLLWGDGKQAEFTFGIIDRGGHRAGDVDFICKHFPGGKLKPYVGLTQKHPDRPMVYKSDTGDFYLGQTDPLSEDVAKYISADNFSLPMDVEDEFVKQIPRQFHQKKISPDGTVKTVFVHNYQGDDHVRDTLNLNLAAGIIKGIDKILVNPQYFESLRVNKLSSANVQQVSIEKPKPQTNRYTPRGYFSNIGGRGR